MRGWRPRPVVLALCLLVLGVCLVLVGATGAVAARERAGWSLLERSSGASLDPKSAASGHADAGDDAKSLQEENRVGLAEHAAVAHAVSAATASKNSLAKSLKEEAHAQAVQHAQQAGVPEPKEPTEKEKHPTNSTIPHVHLTHADFDVHGECGGCKLLMAQLADATLTHHLNREQRIVHMQSICQQGLHIQEVFGVQCGIYADVESFLRKGGFIDDPSVDLLDVELHSEHFCTRVGSCQAGGAKGAPAPHVHVHLPALPDVHGDMIVRFALKPNVTVIPRASSRWHRFVLHFLRDVAETLGCKTHRLELRMHSGDQLGEVIIKPPLGEDDREVGADGRPDDSGLGLPSLELARRLRVFLSPSSDAVHVPVRLAAQIDHHFKPQIVPLVVPPVMDAPNATNVTKAGAAAGAGSGTAASGTDCAVLREASKQHCGDTWKCSLNCSHAFSGYLTHCLAHELTQAEHDQVWFNFKHFFHVCDVCTAQRADMVNKKCGLTSKTMESEAGLPPRCPLFCSEVYMPYYEECLMERSETMPAGERAAIDTFYRSCSSCTEERVRAVQSVCDPRELTPEQAASSPFPSTCTSNCSKVFTPFYDACMREVSGTPEEAMDFSERCTIGHDGGVLVRVRARLVAGDASSPSVLKFREDLQKSVQQSLKTTASRVTVRSVARLNDVQVYVDIAILNDETDVNAEDPLSLLTVLALLVSNPSSDLYELPGGHELDASYGVVRLVWATRDPVDAENQVSPLQVAKSQVTKLQLSHGADEEVAYWQAVASFHEAAAAGAPSGELQVRLAKINVAGAKLGHYKPPKMAQAEAKLQLAEDQRDHASEDVIAWDQRVVNYMGDLVADADKTVLSRDFWEVEYAHAVKSGAPAEDRAYKAAEVVLASDVADRADAGVIRADRADVRWKEGVLHKSGELRNNADEAVVNYMRAVAAHDTKARVQSLEAVVEYRKALEQKKSALEVDYRRLVMQYTQAVVAQLNDSLLKQLEREVLVAGAKLKEELHVEPTQEEREAAQEAAEHADASKPENAGSQTREEDASKAAHVTAEKEAHDAIAKHAKQQQQQQEEGHGEKTEAGSGGSGSFGNKEHTEHAAAEANAEQHLAGGDREESKGEAVKDDAQLQVDRKGDEVLNQDDGVLSKH